MTKDLIGSFSLASQTTHFDVDIDDGSESIVIVVFVDDDDDDVDDDDDDDDDDDESFSSVSHFVSPVESFNKYFFPGSEVFDTCTLHPDGTTWSFVAVFVVVASDDVGRSQVVAPVDSFT